MSSERPRLSMLEYAGIGFVYIQAVFSAALVLITFPFRQEAGHRSFTTQLAFAASKTQSRQLSARQLQYLYPPTDEVYARFAEIHHFQPSSVDIGLDARAHWMGSASAEKVLVFFHGGGYCKPATTQLDLLWNIKQALPSSFSICLLSYALAPDAQYPVQLQQAVLLLKYLMLDASKESKNMILCGDSAGGNLVLGVLSHLLHPHPSISPLELRQPFLGAAMVSPWGDFRTSAPSFLKNDYNDSIDAPTLRKWAAYFMNGADADNYNQPFRASDEWWSGLGGVVQSLLITAGTDEVLVDGIAAFAAKIRTIFPTTKTLLASQEYHDQPFMEPLDDGQQRSQQGKLLKAWVVSTMMQDGTKADGP